MAGYDALYEGATSAISSLRAAMKQIEELARFDANSSSRWPISIRRE